MESLPTSIHYNATTQARQELSNNPLSLYMIASHKCPRSLNWSVKLLVDKFVSLCLRFLVNPLTSLRFAAHLPDGARYLVSMDLVHWSQGIVLYRTGLHDIMQ